MDAVISGQAAALALIEGNDCYVVHSTNPEKRTRIDVGALKYLFAGAFDVLYLNRVSREEAYKRFSAEVQSDEALRLSLILLDVSESTEVKLEAARELALIISSHDVLLRLEGVLCSFPLPKNTDLQEALQLSNQFPAAHDVLLRISRWQPFITKVRAEWDLLPEELFEGPDGKLGFCTEATKQGVFRILVNGVANQEQINDAVMQSLIKLKGLPNYRSVVSEWAKGFRGPRKDFAAAIRTIAAEEAETEELRPSGEYTGGYEAYKNVLAQQDAIRELVRAGNVALARRYTDQLVSLQQKSGGLEYAAKSLCNLAQEANACGQYSLQLEWAKLATEIWSEDPMAYGHLADAYICLNRFDEALDALAQVEASGDHRFANTERARILRIQGKLDQALVAFAELKEKYRTDPKNNFAWNGYAEVLRDMWRLDSSLAAYGDAVNAYPNDDVSRCGRAAVLAELGRLEEANAAYEEILLRGDHGDFALNGKAYVLRKVGRLEDSLALYEEAVRKNPSSVISAGGLAHVLRLMKRYDDARRMLKNARRAFPNEPSIVCEMAELFHDEKKLEDALSEYQKGMQEFPWDNRIANGMANIHKELGRYEEALRVYDENISRRPYDAISRSARADLLKRLGDFENALEAYDDIMRRWPERIGARHSKAAVLAVMGRFDEAEALLPEGSPSTIDEWIASHVRGMILLRRNLIDEAITHFESGIGQVPFARERSYFHNALAAAYLKKQEFTKASGLLSTLSEPVSNVLLFHAFAGAGQTSRASAILRDVQSNGSAQIIELSNEIARRYRLRADSPKHDENWIFQKECETLLLEAA